MLVRANVATSGGEIGAFPLVDEGFVVPEIAGGTGAPAYDHHSLFGDVEDTVVVLSFVSHRV